MSRTGLKSISEALDAGETSLVEFSTNEIDHGLAAAIKAESHEIKKLDKIDAKAFERELKQLPTAGRTVHDAGSRGMAPWLEPQAVPRARREPRGNQCRQLVGTSARTGTSPGRTCLA